MSFDEIRGICGAIGMVIFILTFILGCIWALHPGNKEKMIENSNIPFEEE
tara:strand:+ start:4986 stop:5135 length:150 start_codon:yes stop_codon:yes gene_type:complete